MLCVYEVEQLAGRRYRHLLAEAERWRLAASALRHSRACARLDRAIRHSLQAGLDERVLAARLKLNVRQAQR
ncbi:MAG: hypothetical protein ACP5G2_01220 [Candidatus Bipolaricaulaceae bacterium]